MGSERKLDVPVFDVSLIRGMWEGRVKKHKHRQKKEQERKEKSALARIDQQWQYRIYCKTLKSNERNLLHHYLERSTLSPLQTHTADEEHPDQQLGDPEENKLIFQLDGDQWTDFPRELQWMTYLKEWHIVGTKIQQLPEFLASFSQLVVMDLPKNAFRELPPEIGRLSQLRELNVSYNRLSRVPPELGDCSRLQRLELAGNHNLGQLPFELSNLKQLLHLDIAENSFMSIPICALRMSRLQLLDLSNNRLADLPQDMDRLEHLVTLFVHKNQLKYLPHCLTNIHSLKMIVVSGDQLECIPTKLCSNPDIKFIRLYDNPARQQETREEEEEVKASRWRGQTQAETKKDSREKEFMEAYLSTLQGRDTVPYSTTKVSISCLL